MIHGNRPPAFSEGAPGRSRFLRIVEALRRQSSDGLVLSLEDAVAFLHNSPDMGRPEGTDPARRRGPRRPWRTSVRSVAASSVAIALIPACAVAHRPGPKGSTANSYASTPFCKDASAYITAENNLGEHGRMPPPNELVQIAQVEMQTLPKLIREAPTAAVRSDLETQLSTSTPGLTALIQAGGVTSAVPQDAIAATQSPAAVKADTALNEFYSSNCGINLNPAPPPSS